MNFKEYRLEVEKEKFQPQWHRYLLQSMFIAVCLGTLCTYFFAQKEDTQQCWTDGHNWSPSPQANYLEIHKWLRIWLLAQAALAAISALILLAKRTWAWVVVWSTWLILNVLGQVLCAWARLCPKTGLTQVSDYFLGLGSGLLLAPVIFAAVVGSVLIYQK